MNRQTAREYRYARDVVMRSVASNNLTESECLRLKRAAVALAEEVVMDLEVRKARRQARRAGRSVL